jgi:hypothetical protein
VEETFARFRQLELARRALEQPCAEPFFHVTQALADHRRRQAQFPARSRHIASGSNSGEYL